jgi:DNA-binding HxlR family transcriptional regulator
LNGFHIACILQAIKLLKCKFFEASCGMPAQKRPSPNASSATPAGTGDPAPRRRSLCPVACALDLFGDKWTLLIIRDLLLGRSRFRDFTASPEGIPTNILSDRLERLQAWGLARQIPAADGSRRLAYELTEKGLALRPVLKAVRDWGLKWEPGTRSAMEPL